LGDYEGEILKIAIPSFESSEKYVYSSDFVLDTRPKVKISGTNWGGYGGWASKQLPIQATALKRVMEHNNIKPEDCLVSEIIINDLEIAGFSRL